MGYLILYYEVHDDVEQYLEFVELASFARQAKGLLDDDDVQSLERKLIDNPKVGDVIAGTGGVRKLRISARGKGTRGGARVIYYFRAMRGRVYLIAAYAKSAKEDVTADDKRYFRRLTTILDDEG